MLVSVCCVVGGVVLLFVRLGVLSECGESVSCLLVGLCFVLVCFYPWGLLLDEYCESVLCWCDSCVVCRCLDYLGICLGVIVAVVHVRVQAFVSMVFLCVVERESVWVCFVCVWSVCRGRGSIMSFWECLVWVYVLMGGSLMFCVCCFVWVSVGGM